MMNFIMSTLQEIKEDTYQIIDLSPKAKWVNTSSVSNRTMKKQVQIQKMIMKKISSMMISNSVMWTNYS